MTSITVKLTPETAKLFGNKKVVSENNFFKMFDENFKNFDDIKKISIIQKITQKLGLELTEDNELYLPVKMEAKEFLDTMKQEVLEDNEK